MATKGKGPDRPDEEPSTQPERLVVDPEATSTASEQSLKIKLNLRNPEEEVTKLIASAEQQDERVGKLQQLYSEILKVGGIIMKSRGKNFYQDKTESLQKAFGKVPNHLGKLVEIRDYLKEIVTEVNAVIDDIAQDGFESVYGTREEAAINDQLMAIMRKFDNAANKYKIEYPPGSTKHTKEDIDAVKKLFTSPIDQEMTEKLEGNSGEYWMHLVKIIKNLYEAKKDPSNIEVIMRAINNLIAILQNSIAVRSAYTVTFCADEETLEMLREDEEGDSQELFETLERSQILYLTTKILPAMMEAVKLLEAVNLEALIQPIPPKAD